MSIKLNLMLLVLAVILFTGLPVASYAGNQTNAAGSGSVTGMLVCVIDEGFVVDEISLAINSDECTGVLSDAGTLDGLCDEGDDCSACLSSLKRYGMTVTQSSAFKGGEAGEDEELAYHLVEGNAGPFLERLGECPEFP